VSRFSAGLISLSMAGLVSHFSAGLIPLSMACLVSRFSAGLVPLCIACLVSHFSTGFVPFSMAGLLSVAKGNVAHYCTDYKTFDGFVFPTRRRVVSRGDGEFAATGGPSSVLIDIESVVVNRD
jgi:hypothetical protein